MTLAVAKSTAFSFTTTDEPLASGGIPIGISVPKDTRYVCGQPMRQVGAVYDPITGAVAVEFVGFVQTNDLVTIPQVAVILEFVNAVYIPVYSDGIRAAIAATQDTTRMFSEDGTGKWRSIGSFR